MKDTILAVAVDKVAEPWWVSRDAQSGVPLMLVLPHGAENPSQCRTRRVGGVSAHPPSERANSSHRGIDDMHHASCRWSGPRIPEELAAICLQDPGLRLHFDASTHDLGRQLAALLTHLIPEDRA
jgi:hypothetical protein